MDRRHWWWFFVRQVADLVEYFRFVGNVPRWAFASGELFGGQGRQGGVGGLGESAF